MDTSYVTVGHDDDWSLTQNDHPQGTLSSYLDEALSFVGLRQIHFILCILLLFSPNTRDSWLYSLSFQNFKTYFRRKHFVLNPLLSCLWGSFSTALFLQCCRWFQWLMFALVLHRGRLNGDIVMLNEINNHQFVMFNIYCVNNILLNLV